MKKILMILTLAAFTTACNNNSNTTTVTSADTLTGESPLMDAKNTADSAVKEIEKAKDTVVKKLNEEIKH